MSDDVDASLEPEPFSVLLKRLRQVRDLRQLDLARAAYVHDSYFSRLEKGQHQPDAKDLERIKKALPDLTDAEAADLNQAFKRSLLDRHGFTNEVVVEVD